MRKRPDVKNVSYQWIIVVYLLWALVLGSAVALVASADSLYGLLLLSVCAGGFAVLLWLKLGTWRQLLLFVFMSHFLIWFLKLTSTVLPTQYVALLPPLGVGLLYISVGLRLWEIGFRVPVDGLDLLVAGFILISFLQILNKHITIIFGLRSFQDVALFAGMYFVGKYTITSQKQAYNVIRLIAVTVMFASLYAILQSLLGTSLESGYSEVLQERGGETAVALAQVRSYGTLISQTKFGGMCAVGTLCSLAWLLHKQCKEWRVALGATLINIVGLLLSGTRTSTIALFAGIMMVGWLVAWRRVLRSRCLLKVKKRTVAIGSILVAVFVIAVILLSSVEGAVAEKALERLHTISPGAWLKGETLQDRNVQSRVNLWAAIWKGIVERPFLGYGVGILKGGSYRQGVESVNGVTVAENQYLQLWGELGIFGLLLYGMILLVAWLVGIHGWCYPTTQVLGLLVVSLTVFFAVAGISSPPLVMYPANTFFWLVLGIGMNMKQFRQQ